MASRLHLETFDTTTDMTREDIRAPTRLLLFVLANSSLQQLDMSGMILGIGMDMGE